VTGPDRPGQRLLDVVATMDRLRSPGGCPWDAEQTHASLAPYLLEEAYEALEAIEDGNAADLREELGDVLLQVVFHARIAEEQSGSDRWSIDDVADGLVRKLVRRHPHVFADGDSTTAQDVQRRWDDIKAAEKGRRSVTEGLVLGQPALTLAATLQRKAAGLGLPTRLMFDAAERPAADAEQLGAELFALVGVARAHGIDPEAALRATCRKFRDRLADVEHAVAETGGDVRRLEDADWEREWTSRRP
jgi:XTP/dITP diphosphohydrolase